MIRIAVIIAGLIFLAGATNGLADYELFRGGYCSGEQWKGKYAFDQAGQLKPAPDNLYYRFFGLKYQEKFSGSATLFVSFTDRWHRLKAISMMSFKLAIALLVTVLIAPAFYWKKWEEVAFGAAVYALAWIIQAAGFHLFFNLI